MTSTDAGLVEKVKARSLRTWLDTWFADVRVRAPAICIAIGLLVALAEAVPGIGDFIRSQEMEVHDHFFAVTNALDPSRRESLVDSTILVCVDGDSARRLGVTDNELIPRSTYASLIKTLKDAGAHVIGLNVPLEGAARGVDAAKISAEDEALSQVLRESKNVVIASNVDLDSRLRTNMFRLPYPPFVEALGLDSGSVGNALIVPDSDGFVRHQTLAFDSFSPSPYFYKSFALRIAEKELDAKSLAETPGRLFLRKHVYPNRIRINFVGPSRSFKMAPLWRVLDWKTHNAHNGLFLPTGSLATRAQANPLEPNETNPFKDKIVFVGLVDNAAENKAAAIEPNPELARTLPQSFATPVSVPAIPMSDIEIQANVVSNILHDQYLNEPEPWLFGFVSLLIAALFGKVLGVFHSRPWLSLAGLCAFAGFWLIGAYFAFASLHLLIPVVPLVLVALPCWALVILDAETFGRRERRRRTRVFRSLAAKPLAEEIERKLLAELGLEGKRMTVTVVACQLRDFIGNSQDESAEAVMQRLNSCLSVMMDCIGEHHGLVERIWNCGVIGIWGAPIAMAEDKQAKLATDCALAIRKRLFSLHDSKEMYTGLNFNFSCGISTGDSICGTINAIARDTNLTQYGAIGPAVDSAIELESLNLQYGTTFMLSSRSAGIVAPMFEVREIDRLKIRDGNQSVFELLPWEGSLPGALEEAMALFKQGRVCFEEGRVQEAEQFFSTGLRMVPHDKPTMIMLERCREMIGITAGASAQTTSQKMTLKERLSTETRD